MGHASKLDVAHTVKVSIVFDGVFQKFQPLKNTRRQCDIVVILFLFRNGDAMYSSVYVLDKTVRDHLQNNNFSEALDSIKNFVISVMHTQKAPGEVIGSNRLDRLCQNVGDSYYHKTYGSKDEFVANDSKIVILCTGLYKYGGTTLVIRDIIQAHSKFESTVLATNLLNDMSDEDLSLSRVVGTSAKINVAPDLSSADRLKWLVDQILTISPCRIFLLNHHQDSVIISSVQPFLEKSKVLFYHHADHNLCLGVHLEGAIHIDPHNVGFFNCRENEKINNNFYLPLTVDDEHILREGIFLNNDNLVTCSSATFHKFNNFYLYPYVELITERLLLRAGVHYHIGNIPDFDKNLILKRLREKDIDISRFVHIPWVPSLWKALVGYKVDLFIASFPIGGARTSIEVMGAGVPILVHENYLSRFHSSRDIIYPSSLLWKYPEDFFNVIKNVDAELLKEESQKSRQHYVNHYSSSTIDLEAEVERICSGQVVSISCPLYPYNPDHLDRILHFSHLDSYALGMVTQKLRNRVRRKLARIYYKLFKK